MKNKTLLESIERIKVLMEVSIITESVQWATIGKNLVGFLEKLPGLSKDSLDDIAKLTVAKSDTEAIDILAKLANKEQILSDNILPVIYKNLPSEVQKEIEQIKVFAKDQLKQGVKAESLSPLIDKRINVIDSPFDGIKKMLQDDIKKAIPEYIPGNLSKTVVDDIIVTPDPPTPKPNPKGVGDEISALIKEWEKIIPKGKISPKDWLLMNDLPLRSIRANINYLLNGWWNRIKAGREQSLNKIASLIKRASEEYGSQRIDPELYRTIDIEIQALRKDDIDAMKLVYDEIERQLGLTLKDGSTAKAVRDLIEKNSDMAGNRVRWRDYVMDESWIGKLFGLPKGDTWLQRGGKWFWNFIERAVMFLTTGQLRKIEEINQQFFKTYGPATGLVYGYLYFQFMSKVIYPLYFSIFDTFYYGFTRETPAEEQNGETWRLFISNFEDNFFNAFQSVEREFEAQTGQYVDKQEFDFWKSVNPFSNFWDDLENGFDYVTAGRLQERRRELEDETRQRFEDAGMRVPETPVVVNPRPAPAPVVVNPERPNITPSPAPSPGGGGRRRRPGTES
jgi:hypothetical protein